MTSVESALCEALENLNGFVKAATMQATDGLELPEHHTKSELVLNEHAAAGTPLRARFAASTSGTLVGDESNMYAVRLVFHGTPGKNISSICEQGLDPKRRGSNVGQRLGPGEYFAARLPVALNYCKGGHEVVVFAVVVKALEVASKGNPWGDIVVLPQAERALPVATLSLQPAAIPSISARFSRATHLDPAEAARQAEAQQRLAKRVQSRIASGDLCAS